MSIFLKKKVLYIWYIIIKNIIANINIKTYSVIQKPWKNN